MWWVNEIASKKAVLVRYSNVKIVDRRQDNEEYATQVDDLYDIIFDADVKDVPLSKDPVWKGLSEKFNRLGYDIHSPERVIRIETMLSVGDKFYWDFDRYDEQEREKAEQEGVLCLPS